MFTFFKQVMVMNCNQVAMRLHSNQNSVEQSLDNNGYIKRVEFDSYSKYLKFINLNGTHQKLRAGENLYCFDKGRNTTRASSDLNFNHSIIISIPENHTVKVSRSYAQNVEFCIFAKRMIRDACLFIFFSGEIISNQ